MDRVVVTRAVHGICRMQVCAAKDATDDEVMAVANAQNPAGTTFGWARVIRDGAPAEGGPIACADDPGRLHLLLEC